MALCTSKVSLKIVQSLPHPRTFNIVTYPSCSVYYLKTMLLQSFPGQALCHINLHYNHQALKDSKALADYHITPYLNSASTQPLTQEAKSSRRSPTSGEIPVYTLTLVLAQSQEGKIKLGIDFTFNRIKDVKRVDWSEQAPTFREVEDGMCWLGY